MTRHMTILHLNDLNEAELNSNFVYVLYLKLHEVSFAVIASTQLNRPPTSRDWPDIPVNAMQQI